jgi:CBS domain-containing protein
MLIGNVCTQQVVCTHRNATVTEAAQLMRQFHVGTLVVADGEQDSVTPVGLVTDRDVAIGVVAAQMDPDEVLVSEIMNPTLVTALEDADVYETIQKMGLRGVRRLPVVDAGGRLVGIVSEDDLLEQLSREMSALAHISHRQQNKEAILRD